MECPILFSASPPLFISLDRRFEKTSALRLFPVANVVRLIGTHVFMLRQKVRYLLLLASVDVRTSNMKIPCGHMADYVKEMYFNACRTSSTIILPHSTNQIMPLLLPLSFRKLPPGDILTVVLFYQLSKSTLTYGTLSLFDAGAHLHRPRHFSSSDH